MTAELRSIQSGPIRRALDRLDRRVTEVDDASQSASSPNPNNALGIVAVGSFAFGSGWTVPVGTTRFTNYVPFTSVVGRRYRMVLQVRTIGATGGNGVNLLPRGSGADKGTGWDTWVNTTAYGSIHTETVFDGTGVAETQYHWIVTATVATLFYLDGSSQFYIEDLGPNSRPALSVPASPPAWTPINAFVNGWVNYASNRSPCAYRKVGDVVELRMAVKSGTYAAVITTLPAGFRPPAIMDFVGRDAGSAASICVWNVNPDGAIVAYGTGDKSLVALNCSFSTTA